MKRLIASLTILFAASCGGGIRQVPTTVPAATASTIEGVKVKTLTSLNNLSVIVRNTLRLYNTSSKGIVPADLDKTIRAGFVAYADESDRAGAKVVNAVDASAVNAALEPLITAANNLIATVNKLSNAQKTGGWSELLNTGLEILLGLPSKQPVLALAGGVR